MTRLYAPLHCLGCGVERDKLLCDGCKEQLAATPPRCYLCSAATRRYAVCNQCKHTTPLRAVGTCYVYEGLAKELLHTAKYERAEAGLYEIAVLMAPSLTIFDDIDALVPVPTASSRERERGYDHTWLIARQLSKMSKLRSSRLLTRLGQAHQVGSTRQGRIKQMKGAFRVVGVPNEVHGKHLVLIDDVCTTGATLEEAARVLKKAGAKQVDALLFTRA